METTARLPGKSQVRSGLHKQLEAMVPDLSSHGIDLLACSERSSEFGRLSALQRFTRQRVLAWLGSISWGQIDFFEGPMLLQRLPQVHANQRGPSCRWFVRRPRFYSRVAYGGAMGLAGSYLEGDWYTDDLTALLRILFRQCEQAEELQSTFASAAKRLTRLAETAWGNTIARSRKQIAAHYDLSNEFFELFLDPTLMYSSAYFERPDMSLEEASTAKVRQICHKLRLQPGEHVLEIGTGWGGFGLYCTEHHDVRLTTTTISQEQYRKAEQRFAAANSGDRIQLLLRDYRMLEGAFDKLVSIEMIEAVGEQNLDTYFRQCGKLLKPGGRMVIQAIVMPEQRYHAYRRGVDFIQKYIFPGGFLPSITALQQSVGRTTDFRLDSINDLTPHYARTLWEWRGRFHDRIEAVRALGFDDRFIRMWEYYLCYCEAAFREQAVRVVQIVWDRP